MTTEVDDLAQLAADIFAEASAQSSFDRELWSTLATAGLTQLTGAERHGGSDATWREAAVVLDSLGATGAAVPLAENDLLAGWLLDQAGIDCSGRVRTAAVVNGGGAARHVPWARNADKIVLLDTAQVAVVSRDEVSIAEATNAAGEPRDHIRVDRATLTWVPVAADAGEEFLLRGALARALTMVGAMERILDLVIEHTTARVQFGRPVAKFQAVQALVAGIASEAALARAAAEAAVAKAVDSGFAAPETAFAVAAAKSCAGHATAVIVRNAHQSLGAIGFTEEHQLHRFTNRLLSWRAEYGSVRYWDKVLTRAVVDAGRDGLWPLISR